MVHFSSLLDHWRKTIERKRSQQRSLCVAQGLILNQVVVKSYCMTCGIDVNWPLSRVFLTLKIKKKVGCLRTCRQRFLNFFADQGSGSQWLWSILEFFSSLVRVFWSSNRVIPPSTKFLPAVLLSPFQLSKKFCLATWCVFIVLNISMKKIFLAVSSSAFHDGFHDLINGWIITCFYGTYFWCANFLCRFFELPRHSHWHNTWLPALTTFASWMN